MGKIQKGRTMVSNSGGKELYWSAEFYRTYAGLFRDDLVRRALIEYAALLEARAVRSDAELAAA
jgi:hypothetical protein